MTTVKPFEKIINKIAPKVKVLTEEEKAEKQENNIALIGRVGTGKSSTANTLCGLGHFKSDRSSLPVTKTYQSHFVKCEEFSSSVCIIDTPGITGGSENKRVFLSEFKNAIKSCNSGIQAILVVESLLDKYSNAVDDSFAFLSAVFDYHLKRYGILVFTHADLVLNSSEYISKDKNLSELVAKFDNRYVVINNIKGQTREQQKQRSQLFSLIQTLIKNNGPTGFTQRCLITAENLHSLLDVTDAEIRVKIEKEAEHDNKRRQISEQYAEKYHEMEKKKTHLTTPKDVSHTGNAVVVNIGTTVSAGYQNGIFEEGWTPLVGDYEEKGKIDDAWKNLSIDDLQKDQELKLVLVGTTGVGKTSTGNMIIGQEDFQANKKSKSNKMFNSRRTIVNDRQVLVIDTPGLYESQYNNRRKHVRNDIMKLVAPGIPSFVIVLSTNIPFSIKDKNCFEDFFKLFGKDFVNSAVVVFTGADHLKAKESSLSKYLDSNSHLEPFLKMFGNKMVPFNNHDPSLLEKETQRRHLMSIVIQMNESLKKYYTYQQYKQIEQKLQEMEKIKKDAVRKNKKKGKRSIAQPPTCPVIEINETEKEQDRTQTEAGDKKSGQVEEEKIQDQSIEKMGPGKCTVM